jgi:hypothetical protein
MCISPAVVGMHAPPPPVSQFLLGLHEARLDPGSEVGVFAGGGAGEEGGENGFCLVVDGKEVGLQVLVVCVLWRGDSVGRCGWGGRGRGRLRLEAAEEFVVLRVEQEVGLEGFGLAGRSQSTAAKRRRHTYARGIRSPRVLHEKRHIDKLHTDPFFQLTALFRGRQRSSLRRARNEKKTQLDRHLATCAGGAENTN